MFGAWNMIINVFSIDISSSYINDVTIKRNQFERIAFPVIAAPQKENVFEEFAKKA